MSCRVYKMIGIDDETFRISAAAWMPSSMGIARSRTTKSGFRDAAIKTAWRPFTASPTMVQSLYWAARPFRNSRISSLSSAIRILCTGLGLSCSDATHCEYGQSWYLVWDKPHKT